MHKIFLFESINQHKKNVLLKNKNNEGTKRVDKADTTVKS